ncbi:MAG: Stk1 family PASTA domain-containing Ser/Thr kinase [Eubacteriaceae bacterium]|nr:Stk1 family PASTA domain-containing Ser/Thr kinase [Eubacteriaceae bacterium]
MASSKLLSNRYKIIAKIGVGGMAVIYKAYDTLLDRYVAIKVLKEEYVSNEQFLKKFKREAQAAAKLTHANIVNVFDVGEEDGLHYIVMELIEGQTLKKYIEERGCLTWKETLAIALQIASALDTAHRNNIIHRDIKPQNILMTDDGIPKVSDFGIAKAVTSTTVTSDGDAIGSVHYISPEQARGGFVDERSDLYSLGIMMYEMLTGILPFVGDTVVSIAIQHIQSNVPHIETVTQNIPQAVADITNKMTEKLPERRYQNALELMNAIIKAKNNPYTKLENNEEVKESKKEKAYSIKSYSKPKPPEERIILTQGHDEPAETYEKFDFRKSALIFFKERKRIIFASLIFLVMLIFVISVYTISGNKKIEVPNIEGMNIEQAKQTLKASGLKYDIALQQGSLVVPKDSVISQNPKAGEYIKKSMPVEIVLSAGPKEIVMPDVTGQFEVNARSTLENAGLIVSEVNKEFNDQYDVNLVYDQSPKANEKVLEGTSVILYVSKGKETYVMPNLIGMTEDDARAALVKMGLNLTSVKYEVSTQYSKGLVCGQNPLANNLVDKTQGVTLTISKGKITSKNITIDLSDLVSGPVRNVYVRVDLIDQDGNISTQYESSRKSNEVFAVTLNGVGTEYYKIYIDNIEKQSGIITFN